jgi:riboflavin transporter FmnP
MFSCNFIASVTLFITLFAIILPIFVAVPAYSYFSPCPVEAITIASVVVPVACPFEILLLISS